jgi:hypothetical protein
MAYNKFCMITGEQIVKSPCCQWFSVQKAAKLPVYLIGMFCVKAMHFLCLTRIIPYHEALATIESLLCCRHALVSQPRALDTLKGLGLRVV